MKYFASLMIALAVGLSVQAADVTTKITDTHVCCGSCQKAVSNIVAHVEGLTGSADEDSSTISLSGPDTATVQKGADALVTAGFYGKSSNPDIKIASDTGVKGEKVKSLKLDDVHICCGHCVKDINEALSAVPGVTGNDAAKGNKTLTINGDFNDKDAVDALQKIGLTGKVAKE
ncbi:MAG TPA: heavy-metal-associated domain-containing protein [Verrucomicrobiae bacterium]|nr:heavy-metal-associated domain-containing protein [Verrucomicrobiae bacterium]